MSKKLPIGLIVAVVLYVAVRAAMLATSFEQLVMPQFELYPMGTMAELRLESVHFPLRFYYDNAAGQILIGQLTIPFFALFGPSYMTLKLVPATLGLGALLLVWRLLDRHFSRTAANFGALLFALPPPTLLRYSVVCSGNHFENLFFTLLALVATYRVLAGDRTRRSLFYAGLACGVALFVFLGALIPIGILIGMYLGLTGWKRTLREAWPAVVGFTLGVAPLIVVNAVTSGRGLGFLGAKFGVSDGPPRQGGVFERMGDYLGPQMFVAGSFKPLFDISAEVWSALFLVAFAMAYVASIPSVTASCVRLVRGLFASSITDAPSAMGAPTTNGATVAPFERVKLIPFVLYLPLAALAFGLSKLRLGNFIEPVMAAGYRYYLPTFLFALVLVAIWAARLWDRGGTVRRILGAILFAVPLVCGATGLVIVDWSFDQVGSGWRYPGYNFAQMARGLVSSRNALPHDEIVGRIGTFPPAIADSVVRALGFNSATAAIEKHRKKQGKAWTLPIDEVVGAWPSEWHATMANGAGNALRYLTNMEARTGDIPDLLGRLEPATGPLAEEITAGAACTNGPLLFGADLAHLFDENISLMKMPVPLHAAFARGHGVLCGRIVRLGVPGVALRAQHEKETRDEREFLEGFDRGAAGAEH